MSTDRILVRDLLLRGVIGVNDWEREVKQDILINLSLETNLSRAGVDDDIEATVNYKTLTKRIIEHVDTHDPLTVERLAHEIARICVSFEGVVKTTVRVEKPGALRFARSVGVEIERERSDFD